MHLLILCGSKSTKPTIPALVTKPDGRTDNKNKVNQQEILTWKCNHCGIVLRNTRFKIKFQKWYHITKTHPRIDKSEFDQMRTLISAMVTPTNIPRALRLCQIRSWSTIGHEVHCKKKCSTEAFEDMLWQAHDHA